jgi:hypothetical protein
VKEETKIVDHSTGKAIIQNDRNPNDSDNLTNFQCALHSCRRTRDVFEELGFEAGH